MPGRKVKTARQVRYLLSKGSPLSLAQKEQLQQELHRGSVTIKVKKHAQTRK